MDYEINTPPILTYKYKNDYLYKNFFFPKKAKAQRKKKKLFWELSQSNTLR